MLKGFWTFESCASPLPLYFRRFRIALAKNGKNDHMFQYTTINAHFPLAVFPFHVKFNSLALASKARKNFALFSSVYYFSWGNVNATLIPPFSQTFGDQWFSGRVEWNLKNVSLVTHLLIETTFVSTIFKNSIVFILVLFLQQSTISWGRGRGAEHSIGPRYRQPRCFGARCGGQRAGLLSRRRDIHWFRNPGGDLRFGCKEGYDKVTRWNEWEK